MIPGCILSGGEARRLGGKGKALVKIAGSSMIDLVINRINNQVSPLVINTRDRTQILSDKYKHIEDFLKVDGGAGPLSGILSAIKWAKQHFNDVRKDSGYVLTVPIDCPFIPSNLLEKLYYPLYTDYFDVVVASSNGNIHPVIALWSIKLDKPLEEALSNADIESQLSIRFWSDVPANTRTRRKLEQQLINKWLPPFNKETRARWSTPFTAKRI